MEGVRGERGASAQMAAPRPARLRCRGGGRGILIHLVKLLNFLYLHTDPTFISIVTGAHQQFIMWEAQPDNSGDIATKFTLNYKEAALRTKQGCRPAASSLPPLPLPCLSPPCPLPRFGPQRLPEAHCGCSGQPGPSGEQPARAPRAMPLGWASWIPEEWRSRQARTPFPTWETQAMT